MALEAGAAVLVAVWAVRAIRRPTPLPSRGVTFALVGLLALAVAQIAPLMGLFGTVVGMIEIFGSATGAGKLSARAGELGHERLHVRHPTGRLEIEEGPEVQAAGGGVSREARARAVRSEHALKVGDEPGQLHEIADTLHVDLRLQLGEVGAATG